MATIRQQILAAMVTALNTGAPAGVPQATQRRVTPRELSELPKIDVAPAQETKTQTDGALGPFSNRVMNVVVRCWVSGDAPEVAADPIVAWVTTALESNRLGGLAENIQETASSWVYDVGETVLGVVEITFEVSYLTARTNQEVKP